MGLAAGSRGDQFMICGHPSRMTILTTRLTQTSLFVILWKYPDTIAHTSHAHESGLITDKTEWRIDTKQMTPWSDAISAISTHTPPHELKMRAGNCIQLPPSMVLSPPLWSRVISGESETERRSGGCVMSGPGPDFVQGKQSPQLSPGKWRSQNRQYNGKLPKF